MRGALSNTQLREMVMELKFQLKATEALLTAEMKKNCGLMTYINKLESQNIPQNQ